MIIALLDFVHAHPLLVATIYLALVLGLDVLLGALDALIRGEFSWDKLPQVLKTKLVSNVYAQALLGLFAASFLARAQEAGVKVALTEVLAAATALYSLPITRDVIQKVGYVLQDLYAKVKAMPFAVRA